MLALAVAGSTACGKKGPPLAPLRLVPAAMSDVTVRRVGDDVQIHFKLPTANANGPGKIDLDRVEIYAVTAAPGTLVPPNRELLTKTYAVATIGVKPPPLEGGAEPPENTPPDTRPGPGDEVLFTEELTEARVKPAPLPKIPVPPGYAKLYAPVPPLPAIALIPGLTVFPAAAAAAQPGAPGAPLPAVAPVPGTAAPAAALPAPAAGAPSAPAPAAPPAPAPAAAAPAPTPAAPPAGAAPAVPSGAAPATPAATATTPPAAAPAPPAAAPPAPVQTTVVRIYAIRGLAKSGRPGPPSARLTVPIVNPPPPPSAPKPTFTETAMTIEWTPPPALEGETAPPAFNVYRVAPKPDPAAAKQPAAAAAAGAKPDAPLNPAPLTVAKLELPGVTMGTEQCFAVRSVHVVQNVAIESVSSPTACVTPSDVFPPAPPQNLGLLLLDGAIELVWDAGSEPDIAGYTVLRADAPGDTLRPLTPSPIRESTFRDTTVRPGARHVYAVVAVDKAGNASPPSARVEGTAR